MSLSLGSSVQAGQPVGHCVKPPTPVDAFAVESGKALGKWVDVEIDPGHSRTLLTPHSFSERREDFTKR